MKFKAKLFKLGNSRGIYIPKSIYNSLSIGEEYEWEVYTKENAKPIEAPKVYTSFKKETLPPIRYYHSSSRYEICPKHPGSMKITCGCK